MRKLYGRQNVTIMHAAEDVSKVMLMIITMAHIMLRNKIQNNDRKSSNKPL